MSTDARDGIRNVPQQPNRSRWKWPTPIEWMVIGAVIAVVIAILLPGVQHSGGGGARREACKHNLKLIGLALHEYHDAYGSFPPAFVADANGRPIHSWRVLILPYLDGGKYRGIYAQYRFDEPWNGPHNKQLVNHVIEEFTCPVDLRRDPKLSEPMTSYVAVVGPETAWRGATPVKLDDITDETSKTLLVVEMYGSGIHWMTPRELTLDGMAPTINHPKRDGFSSKHKGGPYALRVDGSVRFFSKTLPPSTVRAWLTRDGGEVFEDD